MNVDPFLPCGRTGKPRGLVGSTGFTPILRLSRSNRSSAVFGAPMASWAALFSDSGPLRWIVTNGLGAELARLLSNTSNGKRPPFCVLSVAYILPNGVDGVHKKINGVWGGICGLAMRQCSC